MTDKKKKNVHLSNDIHTKLKLRVIKKGNTTIEKEVEEILRRSLYRKKKKK